MNCKLVSRLRPKSPKKQKKKTLPKLVYKHTRPVCHFIYTVQQLGPSIDISKAVNVLNVAKHLLYIIVSHLEKPTCYSE